MKIGILGVSHIGKTLPHKRSTAGHDVKVANSRGPETRDADEVHGYVPDKIGQQKSYTSF